MKNKVIVTVAVIVVLVLAWRSFGPSSPEDSVDYEELDSEIQGLLDDLGSLDVEPDDELTIEPFELDPENEDIGGVY